MVIDPKINNLKRAIAMQEGGGTPDYSSGLPGGTPAGASGEIGAWQWMPGNFQAAATKYGFDPKDLSPTNQNNVAYAQIADYSKQGYTSPQIASLWNSGDPNSYQPGTKQKKGNTPAYTQGVFNYYKKLQGQTDASGGAGTGGAPAPAQGQGDNPIVGAIKSTGSALGGMFKDDFTGLGNVFMGSLGGIGSALQGKGFQYPGGPQQAATDIGGAVGAVSDLGMAAGMITGDIVTGGADIPADPTEAAAYIAARKAGSTALQKTVGRFAAGKGVGLATQAVASGVSTAAKAKGQGQSTGAAVGEGVVAGGITAATFGVMNWAGPKISNTFLGFVSKLKIAPFAQSMLDKVTSTLSSAVGGSSMEAGGAYAKKALNSAASQVVKLNNMIFGSMLDGMKAPTNREIDGLVGRIGVNVTSRGNAVVEGLFTQAKKALAPFVVSVANIGKIVGGVVAKGAEATPEEIDTEIARMTKAGEMGNLSGAQLQKQAAANIAKSKATTAAAQDSEESVIQRVQTLLAGAGKNATVSVESLLSAMNKAPEAAQTAKATSALWDAIRAAVGNDPAGLKAIDDYVHSSATRAAQTVQQGMADTFREASANPEDLVPNSLRDPQTQHKSWQNLVSSVWNKLDGPASLEHLKAVLGTQHDFKNFSTMLGKKIVYDALKAYQAVAGSGRDATPEIAAKAAAALQAKIAEYTDKLTNLPGLLDQETIHFLEDMGKGTADVNTIAKNLGIDASKMLDETGKPLLQVAKEGTQALTLAPEAMQSLAASPVGKFLSGENPQWRDMPAKLLETSAKDLAALKQSMKPEEWAQMGAMTLGHLLQKVTGLWGTADKEAVNETLKNISTAVSGDKEAFSVLFDTEKGEGKSLVEQLSNYATALKNNTSGKEGRVLGNAAASVTFAMIHHVYIAAVLANKAIREALGEEEATALDKVATMSKADFAKQYRAAAVQMAKAQGGVGGAVRSGVVQMSNFLGKFLPAIFKYEVGNRLVQTGVGAAGEAVNPTSENQ